MKLVGPLSGLNYRNIFITIFSLLISSHFLSGCGGGGGGSNDAAPQQSSVSDNIGPEGGTVKMIDPNSTIFGARVEIPAGVLEESVEISMTSAPPPGHLPTKYEIVGSPVQFGPAGHSFSGPITVTIPYNDKENDGLVDGTTASEDFVRVVYADTDKMEWELFEIVDRDTENNLVAIQTNHFSTYLSIIDTTETGGTDPGTDTTSLLSGEHFLANPQFRYDSAGNSTLIIQDTPYYHLTVLRLQSGLSSKLDVFPSWSGSGHDCAMAANFLACSFNAQTAFAKVAQSGDAASWNWNCEFDNHTELRNYDVFDDEYLGADSTSSSGIYCTIAAVDATSVAITWGVDADQEVLHTGTDMLAIRIWANYQQ